MSSITDKIKGRISRAMSYSMFPHLKRFREIQQVSERIIVGGTGASQYYRKHEGFRPGDADLTVIPCSVRYMFNIVKNYHSYLKDKGEIIVLLNPYSLCIEHYSGQKSVNQDFRFYPVLHNAMIETYNKKNEKKINGKVSQFIYNCVLLWVNSVFWRYSLKQEKAEILAVLGKDIPNADISERLHETIDRNVSVLREMIDFSEERGYGCRVVVMKEIFGGYALHGAENMLDEILYERFKTVNISI